MSKQLFLLRLKIGNKWLVQEKKKSLVRGVLRTLSNIYDGYFHVNS